MTDWSGRQVLVTGAEGFIGSHLAEELLSAGANVRALVHYNPFGRWGWLHEHAGDIDIRAGDVRDAERVAQVADGVDVIFHLAALVGIPYSYEAPESYVQTNIIGTHNLLQAARRAGVSRYIQTSTSEVYGSALQVPIDEDHPLQPQSPYSASKIGADQIALSFHRSFDTPVVVLRPFNTYGPRQSARAVIPTVIAQIASGKRRIKLGAVHPTRDFNFVTDTAAGFLQAMAAEHVVGETINLGSDFEISIGDTARVIAEAMGVEIEIETDDQRMRPEKSEVERLLADCSKAKRLLGWKPAYAGLDGFRRGLAETARWFTDPRNLARYKPDIYAI